MKQESLHPTLTLGERCRELVAAWNHFWFTPADPTVLGLMRIFAGIFVLWIHFAYSFDLQEFFGRDAWVDAPSRERLRHEIPFIGRSFDWNEAPKAPQPEVRNEQEKDYLSFWRIHPRQVTIKGEPVWSIWFHVTDPKWMNVVHGAILVVMFLFAIGFCTRITSVLTWIGAISYIQRAPTTLFGMDTMMNLLLIYLMIGPSGAALSVDRLIARHCLTWRALRARRPIPVDLEPAPRVSANLAIRLIQVNVCLIYLASGLSKLQGQSWWNFNAIWFTLANPEFSPVQYRIYMAFLQYLCRHRLLWELFMTGGVVFTLCMEIGFPFLIWNRHLRWVMICSAVMLHTGIATFMGLNVFSLLMMTLVMSFLPVEAVHRFLVFLGRGSPHLRVAFSSRDRTQVRMASVVHAFDFWDQVEFIGPQAARTETGKPMSVSNASLPPAGAADHFCLVTDNDEILTGYPAFMRLVRSLRLLWPIALITWVPGIGLLGELLFPPKETSHSSPAMAPDPRTIPKQYEVPS